MKSVALYYDPEWAFNQCSWSMSSMNGNPVPSFLWAGTDRPLKLCLSVSRAESA